MNHCPTYKSFNCQNCGYSGTLAELGYVRQNQIRYNYYCQICSHDNTEYLNNKNILNYNTNCKKQWK